MQSDWNYSKLALHHAGRSFSCGGAAHQLQDIQTLQMGRTHDPSDDIGYHYAVDCFGSIYEGRDIRFKGENVHHYNTGVIGIVLLENLTSAEEGGDSVSLARRAMQAIGFNETPKVPDVQNRSIARFISILQEFFHIHTLGGHREFPGQLSEGKICPGNVGMALVKELRKSSGLAAP
jgi:hypothetical protein